MLDDDGETATLISKYGLDAKPYNTEWTGVTWESCSLREWLNGEFMNEAFSAEEQARLKNVTLTSEKTQGKVYLLSIDEAKRYFTSEKARECQPTKTAAAHGAYQNSSGNCMWWLRSPISSMSQATYVSADGSISDYGTPVVTCGCVRPVVVLQLP